jgi:phosphoglycolate phosphatase
MHAAMDSPLRVDALIFDLDGTLADSLGDIGTAMNAVLTRHGRTPHPIPRYKEFVGEGGGVLVRRAFRAAAGLDWREESLEGLPAPHAQLLEEYGEAYDAVGHKFSAPYPGIPELLAGVIASGRPRAVLSNKRDDFSVKLVKKLFGEGTFVAIRGEQAGVPRKPDPTAALELALALDVLPERIGFVGDTSIDMRTARNAGMVPLGVLWGFRGREELLAAGARRLFETPAELLAALPPR